MPDTRPTYDHPSVTVDNRDGQVFINVYTDIMNGEGFVLQLGPGEALRLMGMLANQCEYAAGSVATSLYIGDCDTCKNRRLVPYWPHGPAGRESDQRCPDCGPRWHEAQAHNDERFPPYPRVGGGVR